MKDDKKTKPQLIQELERMRRLISNLTMTEEFPANSGISEACQACFYQAAIEAANAVPYHLNYLTDEYQYVGDGINLLTGYSPEEFTAKVWDSLVVETAALGETRGLSYAEAKGKALKSSDVSWRMDYHIVDRNGKDKWIANAAVFIRDETGNPVGAIGILEDVTDRIRGDQRLRLSEEKYRNLFESLTEGVWAIDQEGCTTFVNVSMANMLGYSVEEMEGESLFAFMDERGVEISKKNIERGKQGVKERHDFELIRKDGKRVFTSMQTSPITDDEGNYAGAVAGVQDLTERRLLEER